MPTYYAEVDVSIRVPGLDKPVRIQQFVPITITETATTPEPPPLVRLPGYISRKRPSVIEVNGQPRKVAACVATFLDSVRRREGNYATRPETLKKLAAQVPEIADRVVRDGSRKCRGGLVPVCVEHDSVQ